MKTDIWMHDMFFNDNIPYTFNTNIIEYDMKEAGFSITKEFHLLDDKTIERLEKLKKEKRTIELGLIQKNNKEFKKALKEGFQNARKGFFIENDLDQTDIISIKKDAIFTKTLCRKEKLGEYIYFRPKNKYTSYINLNKNLEFYYNPSKLDVKGISEENLNLHKNYMIKFIKDFFHKMETEDPTTVLRFTKHFIDKYKRKELPIGYYRTLNHQSMFRILNESELYQNYFEEDRETIDIRFNFESVLLKLISIPL